MQNNKETLGQLFRDGIEGFEEDLPIRVWDNVSNELSKEKDRKKTILHLSIAASIAIIVAFGSGYFVALNNASRTQYSNAISYKRPFIQIPVKSAVPKQDLIVKSNQIIKNTLIYKTENKINSTSPSEKYQQSNILSYQQSNTMLKQDSVSVVFDSVYQNKRENMAENAIINAPIDSSNIKTPILDLKKNITLENNNQIGLINKNQNNVINNIPEKKINESEKESGKWSLAEQFSPVYSLGNTQKGVLADATTYGYSANNLTNKENYNQNKTLLVYATGVNFRYQINKKWGIKSGVYYATDALSSRLQHKQIEVPLMANYGLINTKFIWELDGGFSPNFLFSGAAKSTNYSALVGTTLGYSISKRVSVSIQPTIKYNFSFPGSYLFHYYPISFAVYTGISYKF